MQPIRGLTQCLLVASPLLSDDSFVRSVIHILEHNEGGTMGVIINRPILMSLGDVWDACPEPWKTLRHCCEGGPVDRHRGIMLHESGITGSVDLGTGIATGSDAQTLYSKLQHYSPPPIRLFLGHAGWAPGQLEAELASGSWLLRRSHPRWILHPAYRDTFWQELVQSGNPFLDGGKN